MIEFNATLIVAMLSFVVFILIMNAIFYKPILAIIKKRDLYIRSNNDDSENLVEQAKVCIEKRSLKLEESKNNCKKQVAQFSDKIQRKAFEDISKEKFNSKLQLQSVKNELDEKAQVLQDNLNDSFVNELSDVIIDKITKGVK